jgi:hypothetical protein
VRTLSHKTVSRLPASRFPDPAEVYFCDNCGRDLTKNLHQDRTPVWQPLHPIWYVCLCGRKYLSGAAEWDDLTTCEREQRIGQLAIGFVLFTLLVVPVTLAYFALRYGGVALLAIVGIALIPSILVAKPFGFVLLDVYEIILSMWRTRVNARRASLARTITQWMRCFLPHKLRLTPVAAVIAMLIIATRWIPSHLGPASPMNALSSPQKSNAARQESLLAPARLPLSLMAASRDHWDAPSPAFRRVRVGPDEVDYVAEDVTVRHFTSTLERPQAQREYKEVHLGSDVTIRYFASKPAATPQTRPVPIDHSLPL